MTRMRVALFENHSQAEPARRRLVQAGIGAETHFETGVAKLWFVTKAQAGVRLEVPVKDAERARHLLVQWDAEPGCLQSAIHCPECKSLRIDFPQFTEKSLLTNLAMGLMAECRLLERQFYCEDCHCMWAKSQSTPHRLRAHTAPNYFLEILAENTPSGSICRVKPPTSRPQRGLKAPNWRKRVFPSGRRSLGLLKLWRRILAIIIVAGAMYLQPGGHYGLLAMEPQAVASDSAIVSSTSKKLAIRRAQRAAGDAQAPTYLRDVLPILMGKCARCHSDQSPVMKNWLDYKTAWSGRWEIKRRVWDSWKGAYFKQPMPTANSPEAEAITDQERDTIRHWVESGAVCGVRPVFTGAQNKPERIENGKRLFSIVCAACHQPTGQGIPGRFPPLAGSDFLNYDKHRAIKVVVNGLQGEVTVNGSRFNNSMPKFPLSDEDIANALTYVYNSFGNSGKDVTPQEVSAARAEQAEPSIPGANQTASIPQEKSPFE